MAKSSSSKALTTFNGTVARSLGLVQYYLEVHATPVAKRPPVPSHARITDLVRAAIVLSVSAMDAYFTDRFLESFAEFVKKNGVTTELERLLERAGLDTREAVGIAQMKRPLRRLRTLLGKYLEPRSFQRMDKIDGLYLAYGIKDFTSNAQGITGRKKLLRSVEKLVEQRHKIVHAGDLDAHGKLRSVAPATAVKRIEDLITFVLAAEKLISKVV